MSMALSGCPHCWNSPCECTPDERAKFDAETERLRENLTRSAHLFDRFYKLKDRDSDSITLKQCTRAEAEYILRLGTDVAILAWITPEMRKEAK